MTYDVLIDGKPYRVQLEPSSEDKRRWVARLGERILELDAAFRGRDSLSLIANGASFEVERERGNAPVGDSAGDAFNVVISGRRYAEAMKMQNEIKSPKRGVVRKLFASEGAAVNAGDVLAIVE